MSISKVVRSLPGARFNRVLALSVSVAAMTSWGCVEVPKPSAASAASNEAAAAPAADVTRALRGDPPLPSEPAQGWIGLETEAPTTQPDPHAHHRHGPQGKPPTSAPPAQPSPQGHDHAH